MDINPGLRILETGVNSGKIIQLHLRGSPILVIGSDKKQHAELLEQILTENDIPFKKTFLRVGGFHAEKQGEEYEVVGMGFGGVYGDKDIRLFGESKSYGLKPNQEHLEKIKQYVHGFNLSITD